MSFLFKARACGRVCLRFVSRFIRFLFILALVALPAPLVAWMAAVILDPARRNLPAEVIRKEE
jgi:hypothetical protein